MLQRPRFKPHFQVQNREDEGVFVLSENSQAVLTGRLHRIVAPLIDGVNTSEEIVELLRSQLRPSETYYTIYDLEQKGYLLEGESYFSPGESSFWSIQNITPEHAAQRLCLESVRLTAFGDVPLEDFRFALSRAHIREAEMANLEVVVTDDYLRPELAVYNQRALATRKTWLLVKPFGLEMWIGPFFETGKTACWECLAERLRVNRPVESYVRSETGTGLYSSVFRSFTPGTLAIGWNLAATEIANRLVNGRSLLLDGKVQTFNFSSWEKQSHTLVRRPQCPVCGTKKSIKGNSASPITFRSFKKVHTDGGQRVVGPAETMETYQHHISPITGAVPLLERCDPMNDGVVHVYLSGPNCSRPAESLAHLRSDLRNRNSGKGITDIQARASGLCEALERHSGAFKGDEPKIRSTLEDLKDLAIHPNSCMLFSEKQYAQREKWNSDESFFTYVPLPFDTKAEIDWTPVWSLTHRTTRYLPTGFCYFSYPFPRRKMDLVSCSNGSAAGNTLEEATLQGFLELVERDSVALWWYNRIQRPGVDLDSLDDPYLRDVRDSLARRNRNLWALDLTADLGIPVFVALTRRIDDRGERILMGFGAHLDSKIALLRAVTECNQVLASCFPIVSDEEHVNAVKETLTLKWLQTATVANQPYLLPQKSSFRVASDFSTPSTEDLRDDILSCQKLVECAGLEMLVLNQTREDIQLPVVKVIVPGLRHFFARFAPGRLYDVPVSMNWLEKPIREEELNPQPMFL